MQAIIEKIDSVEISVTNQVRAEDVRYCHQVMGQYFSLLEALKKSRLAMENLNYDLKEISPLEDEESEVYFEYLFFDPHKILEDIKEKIQQAKDKVILLFVNYFNVNYNIEVKKDAIKFSDEWESMVKDIITSAGGLTMREAGVQKLISDFNNHAVNLWGKKPELQAHKVVLTDFRLYRSAILGNDLILDTNFTQKDRLNTFLKALSYFEFGKLKPHQDITCALPLEKQGIDFSKTYEFSQIDVIKVKGIRFFKNDRVDILFRSLEAAKEFYDTFYLHNRLQD